MAFTATPAFQFPPEKKMKFTQGGPQAYQAFPAATTEGEVRFQESYMVQAALAMTGTDLGGSFITVTPHQNSTDFTKVLVQGFGPAVTWKELKDHFQSCGAVAHADVKGQSNGWGGGGGGGGGGGRGGNLPSVGEVRMSSQEEALLAMQTLNGSQLGGATIEVKMHSGSKDATKLQVTGIPPGASWQDLKDHFRSCGNVISADTTPFVPGEQITGEVRFMDPQQTMLALTTLNGSFLGSSQIFLSLDQQSTDQSKLNVTGISPASSWQDLKDHFAQIGQVAFADVHRNKGAGKGAKGSVFGGNAKGAGGAWGGGAGGKGGAWGGGGAGAWGGAGAGGGAWQGGGKGAGGGGKGAGGGMVSGGQAFPRVPGALTGTVRYQTSAAAQQASQSLNGVFIGAGQLTVDLDWNSQDGTKLWVGGIPPGTSNEELKATFEQCGPLAHAHVNDGKGKGKGGW